MTETGGLIRDEVYRAVVEQVVGGALQPGDQLSERTLAAELGVSRMPVKEAVRRLESEGFVRTVPRQGIVVAMSARDSVRQAVEARAVLEGLAAGLVARSVGSRGRAGAALGADLDASVAAMRRASRARDVTALRGVNTGFHELIRRQCGNQYVPLLSAAVLAVDAAVRRRALTDLAEMRRGIREHAAVTELIRAGDVAGAEAAMRAHILRSGRFVLRHLGDGAT